MPHNHTDAYLQGFSRQETHEEIRVLSHEAGAVVKQEGKPNDLIERIKGREFFKPIIPELQALIDPSTFTGRSAQIVEDLVRTKVAAALDKYASVLEGVKDAELNV
jgi:adenylosuccinate lyase